MQPDVKPHDDTDLKRDSKIYKFIDDEEGDNDIDSSPNDSQYDQASLNNSNSIINSIGLESEEAPLFPDHESVVFGCLTQKSKPRIWFLRLISSPWFEKASLFVIIINCITMGMHNPCEGDDCATFKCLFLKYIDDFIYLFFLTEMLIKIFAMGLYGAKSYLAEPWNRLDCFIVLAGATDYMSFSENSGITAIRTIRVLRPLRAINKAPSMRILVTLIIDTIPMLGNVCALAFLVFIVFGIVGVQLWKGLLRNRCYSTLGAVFNSTLNKTIYNSFYTPEDGDFLCTTGYGMQTCSNIPSEFSDQFYSVCKPSDENPFGGSISFDNIGYAFIVIFQIVTLESWVTIMYHVQDVHSEYAWIYFVLVIVIGSFFLLNMVLVVISVQFGETKNREVALMDQERQLHTKSTDSFQSILSTNVWEEILLFIGHGFKKAVEKVFGIIVPGRNRRQKRTFWEDESARDTTMLHVLCCCCFSSISESAAFNCFFRLREKAKMIIITQSFQSFILGAIVVNSFFMAIEYHNQPDLLTKIVEWSNYIFTFVFFFEMLLKLFGLGIFGYIRDPLNMFDFLIVAISIFEVFSDANTSGISVLRTFRLLRLVKLFRFIKTLKRQIVVMVKTLDSVATFCLLVLLFMFIFSTLGMHLFGCKFYKLDEDGEKIFDRKNFDSLFWSMITVFQILTQEDWNEVMYMGMETSGPWASIYFILLMVFGNYVLFSLLVAILVEGFSEVDTEVTSNSSVINQFKDRQKEIASQNLNSIQELQTFSTNENNLEEITQNSNAEAPNPIEENAGEYSCYLFSEKSSLRQKCINIVSESWFSNLIFFFIFLNCITLAMENPSIKPDSFKRSMLNIANIIFTFIFTVEAVMKIIALGFIEGKDAYLKDGWNIIDFSLVLASLADLVITAFARDNLRVLSLLKILRIMRTLRPLRAINNAPGLKLVVTSLLSSLRPIGNTVIITTAFFVIFAILGVQLFKGKMYYCDAANLGNITTRADCEANNFEWVNTVYNYDNIFNALFTLFIIATLDGWVDAMYNGIDAVGVDMQPIKNHNEYMAFFFLIYLLVVGFFVVNMFVGVIIDNFHKCCEAQAVSEAVLNAEKNAKKKEKMLKEAQLPPYYSDYPNWRKKLNIFICHPCFDLLITACILLNIVTMAVEYYMMSQNFIDILEIFNYVFTLIFLIEAILRIVALGPIQYLKDWWNILDMFIVVISIATIVINRYFDLENLPVDPTVIRVIRIIRIARVLKLLKTAKGIQSLLNTVGESMLQVGNLALLFGLFFFIFSTLGVEIFGKLQCDSRYGECGGINKHTNFNSFGEAFLTLFRITTGDAWSTIMKDTMKDNIVCMQKPDSNGTFIDITGQNQPQDWCLYSLITPAYFIFFVLSAQFILMNLVIAVLMKELEEANKEAADEEKEEQERANMEQNMLQENTLKDIEERTFFIQMSSTIIRI